MKKISILIPCYNEEENVGPISEAVVETLERDLPEYDYELVFIDNDSTDQTRPILRKICSENPRIKAIFNAKNFGQFNSPYYGMLQCTGDCVIIADGTLYVMDYKNGKGVFVSCDHNPQMMLYALGAYHAYGYLYSITRVSMTIIQPRLESVSEETLDREALLAWAEAEVREKAQLAWKGIGDFVPGDHCRFCPAKAVCSARVAEALKLFRYGFETPGLIPDEQVPGILETLDTAEAWIKDFRAYAEKQALNGQKFPGWKLVRGKKPNRRWADPEEVRAQLLRAGYAPGQIETTSLKPVGEIEKAIGAKAFRALVGGLVAQGEGRLTLVPESDKRLEYASADAAFADLID